MFHRQSELKALGLRQALAHFGRNVNSSQNIYATAHTSRPHTGLSYKFAHEIAHFALSEERVAIVECVDSDIFFDLRRQLTRQFVFYLSVLPFGLIFIEIECHIVTRDTNVVPTRSLGIDGKIAQVIARRILGEDLDVHVLFAQITELTGDDVLHLIPVELQLLVGVLLLRFEVGLRLEFALRFDLL